MKLDFTPRQIAKIFSRTFHRYHVMIFVLTVLGGLSVATLLLYQTILQTNEVDPNVINQQFDEETIEKIKSFKKADENTGEYQLPPGRTNPFE